MCYSYPIKNASRGNKNKKNRGIDYGMDNEDILKRQCKKVEDEINAIKEKKLGRVGNIFKIKEIINGPKKGSQEPCAVRDPVSDDIVFSSEEIKRVTLDCVNNLYK